MWPFNLLVVIYNLCRLFSERYVFTLLSVTICTCLCPILFTFILVTVALLPFVLSVLLRDVTLFLMHTLSPGENSCRDTLLSSAIRFGRDAWLLCARLLIFSMIACSWIRRCSICLMSSSRSSSLSWLELSFACIVRG